MQSISNKFFCVDVYILQVSFIKHEICRRVEELQRSVSLIKCNSHKLYKIDNNWTMIHTVLKFKLIVQNLHKKPCGANLTFAVDTDSTKKN